MTNLSTLSLDALRSMKNDASVPVGTRFAAKHEYEWRRDVEQKFDTLLDELVFIDEKLHGDNTSCYAAYSALVDFGGDFESLYSFFDDSDNSHNDHLSDAMDILVEWRREIIHGYWVDEVENRIVLDCGDSFEDYDDSFDDRRKEYLENLADDCVELPW